MDIRRYDSVDLVARAAAENTVALLNNAISMYGRAVWVVAGGSSPLAAYRELINRYADAVEWDKVIILIGDERFVPLTHEDSNWRVITKLFGASTSFSGIQQVQPDIQSTVALTAEVYEQKIHTLGVECFDVVWLGVGEDGHTLSLFPDNTALTESTDKWVVPVYDAPKPPSQRMSLSLTALKHAKHVIIFATGSTKRAALRSVREGSELPIAIAAKTAQEQGATIQWLYDTDAWHDAAS